jgi:hypothetical protein
MGLIKKVDVEKHLAARRAMRLGRTGPLGQFSARSAPAAEAKSAAAFIEDVKPAPLAADSDGNSVSTISRSRQG